MPYNPQQIYPSDLDKDIANGINLPFNAEAVFSPNYTNLQATKNNLLNWLLTNPGERRYLPTFGFGLRLFIFEQINTNNLDMLKERISTEISQVFPSIIVNNLTLTGNSDVSSVTLTLEFSIANTKESTSLTTTLTNQ